MNGSFEWDADKAAANLRKHGVGFAEAATVFSDPLLAVEIDAEHSAGELRYRAIGESSARRLLVVTYNERGPTLRLISARRAVGRERRNHENR
jgi:uncharacterized protein